MSAKESPLHTLHPNIGGNGNTIETRTTGVVIEGADMVFFKKGFHTLKQFSIEGSVIFCKKVTLADEYWAVSPSKIKIKPIIRIS